MKILITGSAGRVGRAIYIRLMQHHQVVGIDTVPCSTTDYVGDIRNNDIVVEALTGVEIVIHTAALHAPHVGLRPDAEFNEINVNATKSLARIGLDLGLQHFIFTSTTALYGLASTPQGIAGWVDENVTPAPKTIYHKTKLAAERQLETIANRTGLPVTVLRMSRCFPEPANLMAIYRLTRGIDARDVASAHACAVDKRLPGFKRYIISAETPFTPAYCEPLYHNLRSVLKEYAPDLVAAFAARDWSLPKRLDRVYDSALAQRELDWRPRHGYQSVLDAIDDESAEVLPATLLT